MSLRRRSAVPPEPSARELAATVGVVDGEPSAAVLHGNGCVLGEVEAEDMSADSADSRRLRGSELDARGDPHGTAIMVFVAGRRMAVERRLNPRPARDSSKHRFQALQAFVWVRR